MRSKTRYVWKRVGSLIRLGVMFLLMLASFAVAAEPAPSESIAGCYYQLVTPFSNGTPEPDFSTLELIPMGADRYRFSFSVIGANFHQCSGEGIAVVKKGGKNPVLEMVRDAKQIEEEAKGGLDPCRLRIRFTRDKVLIEDLDGGCHASFGCSHSVSYTDANFIRKDKKSRCPDNP